MLCLGPNLFIDNYLIAESRGLTRRTHQPEKYPAPVLGHDRPTCYMKVIHDRDLGRYRMWYNAMAPQLGIAYAESRDAIDWTLPDLGSGTGNYVDTPKGHWGCTLVDEVVDEGPGAATPEQRFKVAWYDAGPGMGMCVAFSSDGRHFRPHDGNPVIKSSLTDLSCDDPGYENTVNDILDICVDPLRHEYLLGCKVECRGFPGKPKNIREGSRRCVAMSTSRDFVSWARPQTIVTPDPKNGLEEFYGFKPMVRGNLYLGFLRVLRDDLPATPGGPVEGIGWTELMSSRDGRNWIRYQEHFISPDSREGRWDHAMAWYGDTIAVGDKDYIYFVGYRAGHKIRAQKGDRELGLAILRKNGFVSRDANADGGFLKTHPSVLPGEHLMVNANIRGKMSIRLVGTNGQAMPGYDWPDGVDLHGDSVAHRVAWKGKARAPKNEALSIECKMNDVELYGFDFSD